MRIIRKVTYHIDYDVYLGLSFEEWQRVGGQTTEQGGVAKGGIELYLS